MSLIRILVDGYSLLHAWPDLARGRTRHSETAREALIAILTRYQTSLGTPITVFFDGQGSTTHVWQKAAVNSVEVIFSRSGQTADDLIERAVCRFQPFGPVLVITDDYAERDTVTNFGGLFSGCATFIAQIGDELDQANRDRHQYNRREQARFRNH